MSQVEQFREWRMFVFQTKQLVEQSKPLEVMDDYRIASDYLRNLVGKD